MDEDNDLRDDLSDLDDEMSLDDVIDNFMKSKPKDEDGADLSDDEDDDEADADEAEDEAEEEDSEEDEEGDVDPEESDDEEGDEEEEEPAAKKVASDDDEVAVTVDGKELRVSVKELKRLYGQEASLTQKSQSLANQRRVIDAQTQYVAQRLQDQYSTAKARADKFKDVDLFSAARELEPEEFNALRTAKEAAEAEVKKLEQEGSQFLQEVQKNRQAILKEQARESLKVITKAIPEWNDELYGKVRTFAVSQGMNVDMVNEIVDPSAIMMMHMAMKYAEAQTAAPKVTKKVLKAPKKTVRKSEAKTDTTSSQLKAKRQAARMTGDVDDVTELFLAAMKE